MNLNIIPAAVEAAAHDLAAIGTSLTEANAAAVFPTTSILPAAADEVSAAIAELFSGHGQIWQELQAQAQAFHQQFVEALQAASRFYQAAEDANAMSMLQPGYTLVGTPPNGVPVPNGSMLQPVGQGENIFYAGT